MRMEEFFFLIQEQHYECDSIGRDSEHLGKMNLIESKFDKKKNRIYPRIRKN